MGNNIEHSNENVANKPNSIAKKDEKNRISDKFARNLENFTLVMTTILIFVFAIAAIVEFVNFLNSKDGQLMPAIVCLTAIVVTLASRWAIVLFVRMYEYQKLSAERLAAIMNMVEANVNKPESANQQMQNKTEK